MTFVDEQDKEALIKCQHQPNYIIRAMYAKIKAMKDKDDISEIEYFMMDKELKVIAPGHGDPIDTPYEAIDWIIKHRLQREAKVVAELEAHPNSTISELLPHVYGDVHEKLFGVAERSLLAHLLKLEDDKSANQDGHHWSLTN